MSRVGYFVYILSNPHRTVLYVGMTNNLRRRLREHRDGDGGAFTRLYNVRELLYYESFSTPSAAIKREKQIKRWGREKKLGLVRSQNPELRSIAPQV